MGGVGGRGKEEGVGAWEGVWEQMASLRRAMERGGPGIPVVASFVIRRNAFSWVRNGNPKIGVDPI